MQARQPQVVAVGGGKGGVGKSLLAANLGIFLATLNKKVIVVDLSLGAPNLHLFCGVPRPTRSLAEALIPGGAPLAELAVSTPVTGMRLIGGAADPAWVADLDLVAAQEILVAVRELPCDWVVLDLAGGMSAVVLEFFLGADVGVVAAVPDPTSVELMHRFLGAAFQHRLRQHGLGELADRHSAPRGGIVGPLEIYLDAVEQDEPHLAHLRGAILGFAPQLVINSARSKHDMELGRAITSVGHRRLGVPIGYLGHLEYDEAVWASTRRRRPLLVEHPEARITKCIEKVTRNLLAVRPPHLTGELLPSDSHYDLLEVAPTASFEDIRRANRRIRDVYGAESIAIAGLYDPASLEAVHRRLDLAYTTLMDAAKRKEYDSELYPRASRCRPRRRRPRSRSIRRCASSARPRSRCGRRCRSWDREPSTAGRCCGRSARPPASSCASCRSARRSAWATWPRSRPNTGPSCRRRSMSAASWSSTPASSACRRCA